MTVQLLEEALTEAISTWPNGLTKETVHFLTEGNDQVPAAKEERCPAECSSDSRSLDRVAGLICLALRRIAVSECASLEADLDHMGVNVERHASACFECQEILTSDSFRSTRTPAVLRLIVKITKEKVQREKWAPVSYP
ncbi:hypothetical protein ACFUTV_23380 [Streptomyces sp. NPDC057298]|uniref:hypothetical protein n=1 Tax=Streptomyces sp. NPDC057298 TaxID=3346091 RepID=UPI00362ACA23